MATVKLTKKTQKAAAKAKAGAVSTDFAIQDNGDGSMSVLGVDAAGNQADISALATLTPPPTSSDTSIITVDAPTGMTFMMHAVGPLTAPGASVDLTATATWNDGSLGPFTFTLKCTVVPGPITGVVIVPGVVTVH